jgi:hypothetical protein
MPNERIARLSRLPLILILFERPADSNEPAITARGTRVTKGSLALTQSLQQPNPKTYPSEHCRRNIISVDAILTSDGDRHPERRYK